MTDRCRRAGSAPRRCPPVRAALDSGLVCRHEWKLQEDSSKPAVIIDSGFTHLAEFNFTGDDTILEIFTENKGIHANKINAADIDPTNTELVQRSVQRAPAARVRVMVQRAWLRYLWSVGYIMAGLGLAGTSAFYLDPIEEFEGRLATIFTLLLASIAFQVVVADSLPNIPYISLLEAYVISMNLLLVAQAASVRAVHISRVGIAL